MDEKLLKVIRELVGSGDDAPKDAAIEAAFKGTKFVDLEAGGYVAKDKFETAETKRKAAETKAADAEKERDDLKTAAEGDDSPAAKLADFEKKLGEEKAAREAAEARALRKEREAAVAEKVASPKLRRLLLQDAEALVDDDTDFDAALAKAIEADSDYSPSEESPESPVRVRLGDPVKAQAATDAYKTAMDTVLPDPKE